MDSLKIKIELLESICLCFTKLYMWIECRLDKLTKDECQLVAVMLAQYGDYMIKLIVNDKDDNIIGSIACDCDSTPVLFYEYDTVYKLFEQEIAKQTLRKIGVQNENVAGAYYFLIELIKTYNIIIDSDNLGGKNVD